MPDISCSSKKKSKRIDWFLTSHKHINQQCACLIAASTCQPGGKIRHTHAHTRTQPQHVVCVWKFWQGLITANCQVWPVVGHALLHRPTNSIYFKFDWAEKSRENTVGKNTASCSLNQKQILATNSLCTWHVQKAGSTHAHTHSAYSTLFRVRVSVHGHLKEIWISEFKKRWRQSGNNNNNRWGVKKLQKRRRGERGKSQRK